MDRMTASRHPAMALDAETLLQHSAWLARFARALVANESELDDVVQQTYAQALAQPPRHARNLRGWLGAIARNVVRTRARSDSARVAREVALPPPPPVESPDQAVERAELRRMVVEAVLALNEPYRSTVILRFFEEQEVAAIARLTRTGEDTVRTRLRRGVARVRELLERRVVDEKPGAADEGAAARALLYLHLREIAASAGSPAGAGGGGATGSAAASRGLVREGGRRVATATTRRILVGAATVVVAAGGWWAWKGMHRETVRSPTSIAANDESASSAPVKVEAPAPVVAVERSADPSATTPPPAAATPVRRTKRGVIRGVVTAADGKPVAGAKVWAILSLAHDAETEMPDFGFRARMQAEVDPNKKLGRGWIASRSGEDGRYEFRELSISPGWLVGAYEPTLGAMVSEVHEFDREHEELAIDVKLMPGSIVRGTVRDEEGTPIGGARVFLFMTCARPTLRTTIVAESEGPHVGEFDAGFVCADPIEIGCGTPGFVPTPRAKVEIAPHTTETVVPITLKRKPGIVVRGRIVDSNGGRVALGPLLEAHFASDDLKLLPLRATVWAIAQETKRPPVLAPNMKVGEGIFEGRIDFAEGRYEVVVPEGFRGAIDLRMFNVVVGSAPLEDPHQSPDLPCDAARLPATSLLTKFAVRFVDAETKEPIDVAQEDVLPEANNGDAYVPIVLAESDPKHGLITYRCAAGYLKLEPVIHGYVMNLSFVDVPKEPRPEPMIFEMPPAKAGVHGFALHSDGRPFARAPISVFRRTPGGWVDSTGPETLANPDGEFEFDALGKGEHVAVLSGMPDEAPSVVRFVASDPFPDVELRASVGREIRIRVVAKPKKGPPATRQDLQILDREGLQIEHLHSDWDAGSASPDEISLRLDDGHYTVTVERNGYAETRLDFDVPRESLDVPLEPLDSVSK